MVSVVDPLFTNPDPDSVLFVRDVLDANKNYHFLKVHLHHSPKIKSHNEVTKQQKLRFFSKLWLVDGRIRIRNRTNKLRIRIQEAQKITDPTEPDPEHWYFGFASPRNENIWFSFVGKSANYHHYWRIRTNFLRLRALIGLMD